MISSEDEDQLQLGITRRTRVRNKEGGELWRNMMENRLGTRGKGKKKRWASRSGKRQRRTLRRKRNNILSNRRMGTVVRARQRRGHSRWLAGPTSYDD